MSQKKNFEATKKLLVSLSSKLRTLKSAFPELSLFIEELESVEFLTHQAVRTKKLSNKVSSILKSKFLNLRSHQIEGLRSDTMASFNWMNIYDGANSKHSFINGMFASRLLGLDGYYASDRISVGLMLILPGVFYPLHTHRVKEFYYCLGGKLIIQHDIDGDKFSLSEGEISITPEGKLHSLEVNGKEPVLLLYSWLGNLSAPIRLWEKTKSGSWEGCTWRRLPGQKWRTTDVEILSEGSSLDVFSEQTP